MKKLFPNITDHIGGGYIFCIFATWIVFFILVPAWLPLITAGLWQNDSVLAWTETIFLALIGLVMMMILIEQLKDAYLYLSIHWRHILKICAIALGLMIGWTVAAVGILVALWIHPLSAFHFLPVSPTHVMMYSGFVVSNNPVFGLLVITLLVPFGICGMFYASTFAPVCTRNNWLCYLAMAGVVFVASYVDAFWYTDESAAVLAYLIRLPIHAFACWAYQKTDNVWASVITLAGFNLLSSLACIFFL